MTRFARGTAPADRELLEYLAERIRELRRKRSKFLLVANLFDVHAPYPPSERGIFRPWSTWDGVAENVTMPFVLPSLGGHQYLKPGFHLRATSRSMLLARYHAAIEHTDRKLDWFFSELGSRGLLDGLLVVLTSDHGEAFGEHLLYLHDASLFQEHLHVPLLVHHPAVTSHVVNDVVSTRDLFGLLRAAIEGGREGTLLDHEYRAQRPIAMAEHFHYPNAPWADPRYRQDLRAVVFDNVKVIVQKDGATLYRLDIDPNERAPEQAHRADVVAMARSGGASGRSVEELKRHLWLDQ